MTNMHTKSEVSMFTQYKYMKGNKNVEFGVVCGVKGHPRSHRQCIWLPIRL